MLLLGWLKLGLGIGALLVEGASRLESVTGASGDAASSEVRSASRSHEGSGGPIVWLSRPDSALSTYSLEATRAHVVGVTTIDDVRQLTGESRAASISAASQAVRDLQARAVLFVLQPEFDRAEFYLYDGRGPRLWVRELRRESQSEELWAESIGLVAASVIRALEEGRPVGMEAVVFDVDDTTGSTDPSAVESDGSSSTAVTLSAGYRGGSLARSQPWTHGLDFSAEVTLRNGVAILAGYEVLWPVRAGFERSSISLARHPVRAGAGFRWFLPSSYVRPALMLAIDVVQRRSSTTDPSLKAVPSATFVDVAVVPAIEAGFELTRHVHLFVEVRTEFWLQQRTYSIATPEPVDLVRPFRVRPTVRAGLGASIPRIPRRALVARPSNRGRKNEGDER